MVAIAERVARKNWEITAKNGDHFAVKTGKTYTTTKYVKDGYVTVFSNFWVPVPAEVFVEMEAVIQCPDCNHRFENPSLGKGTDHG